MTEEDEYEFIEGLIHGGEGPTVDFKKSDILSDTVKLARLMVAFANSNGGRILIGICDDGSKEGMSAETKHERHIMNIARDKCVPPIVPDFSVINTFEGDIYVVKVLRFKKHPHAVKMREGNVHFIRVGSTVRVADQSELALLFEATREEVSKRPELELWLLDGDGNITDEIKAQPIIVKTKYVNLKPKETLPLSVAYFTSLAQYAQKFASMSSPYAPKEPPKDLVPIGIEIRNIGEIPAEGIAIFVEFPEECELVNEHEAIGGFVSHRENSGGLFVDEDNRSVAYAWIDVLGNDLTMRKFQKIYIRFPEKEQDYLIKASITQHGFPPSEYEFKIKVEPKIKELVEYVEDEET
jgi:hypothetical protein